MTHRPNREPNAYAQPFLRNLPHALLTHQTPSAPPAGSAPAGGFFFVPADTAGL